MDDNDRSEEFDEMLNECYKTYEIAGIKVYPSTILKECDPIAYRLAFLDWEDSKIDEKYEGE